MKNEKWCGPLTKLRLFNLKTWPPFLMKNEKWFLWAIRQIKAYQFENLAPVFNEK
jgi:hypothetical protein